MFKIVYIDKCEEDFDNFLDYFKENDIYGKFEIECLLPESTLDKIYETISEKNPDAIVSEHLLDGADYNIPYTGADLVEKILSIKENYPCFILTSDCNQAIKASQDVNIVYTKDILHLNKKRIRARADFLSIIENQITHYKKRINDNEMELLRLIEKSEQESLNAQEEARLIELDTFIEKATNSPSALPENLKGTKTLNELHEMIEDTDKLLAELKNITTNKGK